MCRHASFAFISALALTTSGIVTAPRPTFAQAESISESDPRSYELGFHAGPMLPSKIARVREILQGWGLRGAIPTAKGDFEIDTFVARGGGVFYSSTALDYRLDIPNEVLPTHFILGAHMDAYTPLGRDMMFAGGWHYGGGVTQQISGPVLARVDFKYKFSPGQSLYVGLGILYRFPESGQ